MEKFYKTKEVAEMLSVTLRTVDRWRKSGKINTTMVNGRPRISESEIKRILKEGK